MHRIDREEKYVKFRANLSFFDLIEKSYENIKFKVISNID